MKPPPFTFRQRIARAILTPGRVLGRRRQAEDEIGDIIDALLGLDPALPIHGFGVKRRGLEKYGARLGSADSLAWSFDARRTAPLPECVEAGARHRNCANCIRYALRWRRSILNLIGATS